jgi:[NiFe] hydrogenase assembly HybE family chaperone
MTEDRHPRVTALEDRFCEIGETMSDLPFYNPKVTVEAWGFRSFGETELIGVLITPWFMNLVLLPVDMEPVDPNRYCEAAKRALPGGERLFLYGGEETVGALWAVSLHSPMDVFVSQAQAVAEARLRLNEVLLPPQEEPEVATAAGRKLSRRALLAGGGAS